LNWAVIPIFWAVTTEHVSGVAAAVSIALINALANVAGLALPPVIGWIKDTTGSFDVALTLVASALIVGGVLGIALGRHKTSQVAQFSGR
jgi:cyanate permease